MERKVAAEPASEDAKALLAEAKRYKEQGADKPFLDVWFADAQHGYAVGAYNLIFRTDDGGKTWEPWFDRTDNPKFFNLYAIRPAAGELFIAGEGGLVLKLDAAAQRFRALDGALQRQLLRRRRRREQRSLVFGLRGNVYRSDDARHDVDARSTPDCRRRSSPATRRGRRDRCWPTRRPHRRHAPTAAARFAPLALHAVDAAHGHRRCRRRQARARRAARRRGRRAAVALTRASRGASTWPRITTDLDADAGRPRRSRTSTATRATRSSGWCSTTGWRW